MEINEKDSLYIHIFSIAKIHDSLRNNTVTKFVTKSAEKMSTELGYLKSVILSLGII
jgi:hypothetical protein